VHLIKEQFLMNRIINEQFLMNSIFNAQEYFAPVDAPKYRDGGCARIFCASRRAETQPVSEEAQEYFAGRRDKALWQKRRKNVLFQLRRKITVKCVSAPILVQNGEQPP
jgi:hypothetical protein